MNKRWFIKIGVLFLMGSYVLSGCGTHRDKEYTKEDLGNIAKIEVYSAENDELIKTIDDEESIYQYNKCISFDDSDIEEHQEELKESAEDAKEEYYFVSYKYSAAKFGGEETEKNTTVTIYENSNTVKMTAAEESVKGAFVPQEFLEFYYEVSDEDMEFYCSLTEGESNAAES